MALEHGWVYDLALLLRKRPDTDRILSRARELGVRRVTHALLALAGRSFQLVVELPPLDPLQRHALSLLPRFDDPRGPELSRSLARAAFIAALADTPAHGARHLRKKAFVRLRRAWQQHRPGKRPMSGW